MPLFGRIFGRNENSSGRGQVEESSSSQAPAPVSRSIYPGQRMHQRTTPTFSGASQVQNFTRTSIGTDAGSSVNPSQNIQRVGSLGGTGTSTLSASTQPDITPTQQQSSVGLNNTGRLGAYRIDRSPGTEYRVTIPNGVMPGQMFQVMAGNQLVRVRCPENTMPGGTLSITLPGAPSSQEQVANPGFTSHGKSLELRCCCISNFVWMITKIFFYQSWTSTSTATAATKSSFVW